MKNMISSKLLRNSFKMHRWFIAAARLCEQVEVPPIEPEEQEEPQVVEPLPGKTVKPIPPKISASEKFAAQLIECDTKQEAPEPILRVVELEHVRSKMHERDQRKLRHQEYAQMLERLIVKPTSMAPEQKLPFKQLESIMGDLRQSLRGCSSVEEILDVTKDPQQLAKELIMILSELSAEKRKADVILESLHELKREKAVENAIDAWYDIDTDCDLSGFLSDSIFGNS